MAKVLKIAAGAKSGREINSRAVARGALSDKATIMEGLPLSKTEVTARGMRIISLEENFKPLDEQLEEDFNREQQHQKEGGEE